MNQYLKGGRENKIYKKDNCIYRPAEEWTKNIHSFLKYLHSVGFNKVPFPFGINDKGIEILSYVDGTVYNDLLPEEVKSDEALMSVARILKEFHDYGSEYVKMMNNTEKWMFCKREPVETMCHGDFAPYNIAIDGREVIGIIDFDTLHPGPRMWDIAYALYRWIPLMAPSNIESFGTEEDKKRRLKVFLNTYEIISSQEKEVINSVIKRLEYLIDYMNQEAQDGNETFIKNIKEGHLDTYSTDLEYLKKF